MNAATCPLALRPRPRSRRLSDTKRELACQATESLCFVFPQGFGMDPLPARQKIFAQPLYESLHADPSGVP